MMDDSKRFELLQTLYEVFGENQPFKIREEDKDEEREEEEKSQT